ncbi:recombinase family protein [Oscillibacter sp. GMB15532]|uniref:recombinase family protein n=1 Tax=Oscillibacter sp. GMB15532 TaxID=3230022 RepID=UPI0034DE6F2C
MPRIRKSIQAETAKHWNIGIYIRLSREDKEPPGEQVGAGHSGRKRLQNVADDSSGSIVEQDKLLTEWVAEYFREEQYTVVEYFTDDGLTGTDDTRDNFQRMMEFAQDGRINCIVVKTLSRAFRNYADQGRYLEQIFPRLGVRFISSGNPFVDSYNDPDAITGGMEIPINGLMNDRFAAKTSADIRRTFDAKRRRGEFIGAFAPYGYVKDPEDKNSLLVDDAAAGIVRDIFHWYVLDGMSKRGIALRLNELGVPNPTTYKQQVQKLKYQNPGAIQNDGLWSANNVLCILKNQVYIGSMVQGRYRVISYKVHTQIKTNQNEWYVVPNVHEAIVSEELFRQAQSLHSRDTRAAPGKKENYLFSGLLRCADCKKAMRRKTSKQLVYYYCRTVTDKGEGACTKRSIREDKIVRAVYEAIRLQIDLVQSLSDTLDAIQKHPVLNPQFNRLMEMQTLRQKELDKVDRAASSLYMDWKSGDISKEDYHSMKAEFDKKSAALNAAMQNIEREIGALEHGVNAVDPYLAAFLKYKHINTLNRGIVVELIDTIYVHADGQLTIDFRFADEYKRVAEFIEGIPNNSVPTDKEALL